MQHTSQALLCYDSKLVCLGGCTTARLVASTVTAVLELQSHSIERMSVKCLHMPAVLISLCARRSSDTIVCAYLLKLLLVLLLSLLCYDLVWLYIR